MGKFDDIYREARKIDDLVKRGRFINRSIMRRSEGFWLFHLLNIKTFFVYSVPQFLRKLI